MANDHLIADTNTIRMLFGRKQMQLNHNTHFRLMSGFYNDHHNITRMHRHNAYNRFINRAVGHLQINRTTPEGNPIG